MPQNLDEIYGLPEDAMSDVSPETYSEGDTLASLWGKLGKKGLGMNALKGEKLMRMLSEEGQQLDRGVFRPKIKPIEVVKREDMLKAGLPDYDMILDGLHRLTTAQTMGYRTPAIFKDYPEEQLRRAYKSSREGGGLEIDEPEANYVQEGTMTPGERSNMHMMSKDYLHNTELPEAMKHLTRSGKDLHDPLYNDPYKYFTEENSPLAYKAEEVLKGGGQYADILSELQKSYDPVARHIGREMGAGKLEELSARELASGRLPWQLHDQPYSQESFRKFLEH